MYDQVITNLLEFYNSDVERRDNSEYPAWKREERQHFLSLLQQEGKSLCWKSALALAETASFSSSTD